MNQLQEFKPARAKIQFGYPFPLQLHQVKMLQIYLHCINQRKLMRKLASEIIITYIVIVLRLILIQLWNFGRLILRDENEDGDLLYKGHIKSAVLLFAFDE